ncbi:MAG: 50S ribosomal protein L17 [Phycisphaerae bacterium]|nr:50S ribosomal protein L17 [Phycisphaerae bacterium]
MRHRVAGKQLNVQSNHRRAMLRNLAAGLFEHGRIETTMAKAKAVQPFVERLITIALKGNLAARRRLVSRLTDRKVFAWVADPNVPDDRKTSSYFELPSASDVKFNRYGELKKSPRLVQHLLTRVAPMFRDRKGGYTRIVKLGTHRFGDGTDLVMLELVGKEEGPQIGGGGTSRRRTIAKGRTAYAAKVLAARGKAEAPSAG